MRIEVGVSPKATDASISIIVWVKMIKAMVFAVNDVDAQPAERVRVPMPDRSREVAV